MTATPTGEGGISTPTITPGGPTLTPTPTMEITLPLGEGDICSPFNDPNNDHIIGFGMSITDSDSVSAGRYHHVRYADMNIGSIASPLLLVHYVDNGDNTYSVAKTAGSQRDAIGLSTYSRSRTGSTLYVDFSLDVNNFPFSVGDTYDVFVRAEDFAGAVANWRNMGQLEIWNCQGVNISGKVYDVSYYYPDMVCGNLSDSDPNISGLPNTNILFDAVAGDDVSALTGVDGRYTAALRAGSSYRYTLTRSPFFNAIADLADVTAGDECLTGETAVFTVTEGPRGVIDFGMSSQRDPWIQVIGADLTAYTSITVDVPQTCVDNYGGGGECLPFISVSKLTRSAASIFSENSIVAARAGISSGQALAVGDPNNWRVIDANLWHRPGGSGYNYYVGLAGGTLPAGERIEGDVNLSAISGLSDGVVASGEEEVRLIHGNLAMDRNLTVAQGGIALLVVSGNITFDSNVTIAQGIFSADGNISIADGDDQLILSGIFVADADSDGAGSVINSRSLGIDDALTPAAVFIYRPDLAVAMLRGTTTQGIMEAEARWEEIRP